MKIVVAIKQVPARDSQLRVASSGKWIEDADLTYEINEPDAYALEAGLQLKEKHGGEVVALCAGPARAGQTIRELPLATRNFQQLLATNGGSSSSLNSAAQLGRGDVRINVNGGREDNNSYQIDGISANDPTNAGELACTPLPSPDSIQEFEVSTSLYDAAQGHNGGGNINAVLKSGTLNYHFDVFEYFRNTENPQFSELNKKEAR